MKEWFTTAELAEARLPGLAATRQGVEAALAGCRNSGLVRPREGRGGGFEYHLSLLPPAARSKLAFQLAERPDDATRSKMLWRRFEGLSTAHKKVCEERLAVLAEIEAMTRSGVRQGEAFLFCLPKAGIGRATYFEWRKMVEGVARADWLAALAPSFAFSGSGIVPEFSDCHPEAWAILKSDYLRPEKPGFSACYRRMTDVARKKGWTPIPHERSLRRRMEAEVPKAAQIVAREGRNKAAQLFPAQVRSKDHLHAMQIVNTDGHHFDLFVQAPWSIEPCRVTLLGIQDIYSGKILSWRICEAETWEVVQACIGDMVEGFGIPQDFFMDNGRAFASKKISGGARNRNRFKINDDEVAGLLKTLGIEPHFTKPYSGQSKPIERAWKDLAEEISKHPAMSGAYTGNKPDAKPENYRTRAVSLDELQLLTADRIAEHNARSGRRSPTAKGRSFDETFEESMRHPATIVRQATPAQRSLWLLASEPVMARKPSGQIHYLGNIYWHPALNQWAGKKLTIRFEPTKLHEPVKVYDPKGRLICDAECREKTGFDATHKARDHEKSRRALVKHNVAIADIHRKHSAAELGEIYGASQPQKAQPVRPAITRIVTGNLAHAEDVDAISADEFEESFARGLALFSGDGGDVIPFPQGKIAGRPGKPRAVK